MYLLCSLNATDIFGLKIDLADLKFVEPIQGELRRESFPGVKIQYQKSDYSMAVQLAINHLQVRSSNWNSRWEMIRELFHQPTAAVGV